MKKVIFSIIALSIGIGLSIYGKKVLNNAKESVNWPKTNGKVISSHVEKSRSTSGTGSSRKTSTTYHANVDYEYYLKNKVFRSDNVYFGQGGSSNSSQAYDVVNRYPKGKKITVYYKPDNHEIAVIEPGATWSSYMILVGGIIFSVVGIGLLFGKEKPY